MTANRRVAVIGAGASGLSAARALQQEGHSVAVFERSAGIGGTWIYSTAVESDHLSADPDRKIVHSSLYDSLRTNLPRESMGFFDYPFVAVPGEEDCRRFPGHRGVLRYLEDFARESGLYGLIRFGVEVVRVEMEGEGRWAVVSRSVVGGGGGGVDDSEVFDGVVVCVGHYTEPRVAEIPGIDSWPGKQMHSHNYRVPEPFLGQVVVIIGSAASATDISKDIAGLAKEVHIASRSAPGGTPMKDLAHENIFIHSMIVKAFDDGTVLFQDGSSAFVDVIMHCTGYKYHFPFLKTNGIVNVDDNRVGPLYKHVFPPLLAPYLSFIGLTTKIIPFPMFQLQSKWIAGVLSGRIILPTQEEMMEDVKNLYSEMQSAGRPKRYTHNIENYHFEYANWLARECGHPQVEEWRKFMYYANRKNRAAKPERYRDEWDDDDLVKEAHEHFRNIFNST
ncbi:hypothetical protein KFK09_028161 [Dendrobium nobile]|uniref:Flavin-containing monooxygenase n=1 Tax=Dendrobium nobile TaxID=94219 RepID=A0A8T3A2L6_DENNO|nr:hypothetical protein KFK09_028161 [Dendrobium nobile]